MKKWLLVLSAAFVVGCSSGPQAEIEPEKPAIGQGKADLHVGTSEKIDTVAPPKAGIEGETSGTASGK